jgi:hypothetical protein
MEDYQSVTIFEGLILMKKIIALLIIVSVFCVACQKTTKKLANAKDANNQPEYTTEFDVNKSPAK